MEHVLIRSLEHLAGSPEAPSVGFGVETRGVPGPLYKLGAFQDDRVWVQLRCGLFVAKAVVRICWVGEYSDIRAVQNRTLGSPLHDLDDFWMGRPRYGYAGVATLVRESWVEPFWAGPADVRLRVGGAPERRQAGLVARPEAGPARWRRSGRPVPEVADPGSLSHL